MRHVLECDATAKEINIENASAILDFGARQGAVHRRKYPVKGQVRDGILKSPIVEIIELAQTLRGERLGPGDIGVVQASFLDQPVEKRLQLLCSQRLSDRPELGVEAAQASQIVGARSQAFYHVRAPC